MNPKLKGALSAQARLAVPAIAKSNQDDRDEMLTDLLVHTYPTKVAQAC